MTDSPPPLAEAAFAKPPRGTAVTAPPGAEASRKRGAQPLNTNALKHGIYSRHYTPEELRALDRDVAGSLKDEMEILRLTIAGAADSVLAQPEADIPFHDHVSALRTIAVSIARLENVIHTRIAVFGDPGLREKQVDAMLALMEQAEQEAGLQGQAGPVPTLGGSLAAADSVRDSVNGNGLPNHIAPLGDRLPSPIFGREAGDEGHRAGHSASRSSKKKSGGQPGNLNAWKHGFYARVFTPAEKDRLQMDEIDQLRHEETLLRVLILRVWRSLCSVRSMLTYQEYLFTLRSICYAIFVIAKLQRARRRLFGDQTDLEKDIQLGIAEACTDLGILDYLNQQANK